MRGSRYPPAPTKKTSVENTLVFCFIRYLKFHSQGWIRTAAATSLKTAQKQPSATATTAASGRSREELLGLRPARMRVPPKARRSRREPRPGFLFILRGSRYPPAPTKRMLKNRPPAARNPCLRTKARTRQLLQQTGCGLSLCKRFGKRKRR